jgi:hypothetical protein
MILSEDGVAGIAASWCKCTASASERQKQEPTKRRLKPESASSLSREKTREGRNTLSDQLLTEEWLSG